MSFMETGKWRIVMLIDGTDTEGRATYQQIYQHQDGRKACVGPGYCSDPDLEWLLLQKDRKIKAWNTRHTKRKKIIRYVFYAAWIFILIQGVLAIPEHGAWVPFSVWGYGATQTFSFGLINGFRDLLISSPNYLWKQKDISLNIFGCLIFLFLSHWLIDIGRFNSLSILFVQLPLFWFGCFMGFIEELLKIWTDAELPTKPHSPTTREKLCV